MMPRFSSWAVWLALLGALGSATEIKAAEPELEEVDLFVAGEGGYHTYRIPSIIATRDGSLLAFCEGRKHGRSDTGDIDLLARRSTDGGASWSPISVLWDDGPNTCGNPCPVVDASTGVVWLLLTWNAGDVSEREVRAGFGADSRRVFVSHSSDDGQTWSVPRDITPRVKRSHWTWYATGPGAGIQLERGEHAGRLVIPCDHKIYQGESVFRHSHVIYSDDHGATWRLGGSAPRESVNECEVAELSDGRLLLNMRNYGQPVRARQVCESSDGGLTWTNQRHDTTLIAPTCQASLRRLRWPEARHPGVLLFSNPASERSRERLTIRASFDDGATWPRARVLCEGSAAYSCLVALPDGRIGCLYERDQYARIRLARFQLAWVAGEGP